MMARAQVRINHDKRHKRRSAANPPASLTSLGTFDILPRGVSNIAKEVARDLGLPLGDSSTEAEPDTAIGSSDELLPLARAIAKGDPDAAATLVLHVAGPMLRVVRRVLGRQHPDIDDVAQDAAIALLRALGTFRGDCSVVHFANRVALLTALAARRQSRARSESGESHGAHIENLADELPSPLATTLASRRRQIVHDLLDDLPDVIAESLALHFVLGYTVEEIAAAISVSRNTVWSRLRQGKRALRRRLEGDSQLAEMLEVKA
jgi:RNA polymerase sigma-70 factor (ECF subfamily)